MSFHRNATLGLGGRCALVGAIEGGLSIRAAAGRFNVSPATAHRWWRRWREADEESRRTLACLFDRSSRPHRSPRELAVELQNRICDCRRKTGWGLRLVAAATGFAHSTVWKVLRRAGISRPRPAKESANSYEWPCPGDLLHMDVSRYARFERPGHAVTGDRSPRWRCELHSQRLVGYDFAHAIVHDHSRLAYVELHRDERAHTVTASSSGRASDQPRSQSLWVQLVGGDAARLNAEIRYGPSLELCVCGTTFERRAAELAKARCLGVDPAGC